MSKEKPEVLSFRTDRTLAYGARAKAIAREQRLSTYLREIVRRDLKLNQDTCQEGR